MIDEIRLIWRDNPVGLLFGGPVVVGLLGLAVAMLWYSLMRIM